MTGAPIGSTESGSGEAGIKPATPGLPGITLIHYTAKAFVVAFLAVCKRLTALSVIASRSS